MGIPRSPKRTGSTRSSRTRRSKGIPVLGRIPAGLAQLAEQEAQEVLSLDFRGHRQGRVFALRVPDDLMAERHILKGDIVVLEHGVAPRDGDIVAVWLNNQNVIRSFLFQKGKPFVCAEAPGHPGLIPAADLVIQGVMIAWVRRVK